MDKLRILMAASEAGPFVRTGGLGDVMSALPSALTDHGHEVKVFLPRYSFIDGSRFGLRDVGEKVAVAIGKQREIASIETVSGPHSDAEFCFVSNKKYFGRSAAYVDPATRKDYTDNDMRFSFFCRAIIETVLQGDWQPDIIHVHDWQAALLPVYLKTGYSANESLCSTPVMLTIHNLAYQGLFDEKRFPKLDLPEEMLYAVDGPLEFYNQSNLLKGGIVLSDVITTVSEQYASEIQTEELGCGLEGVLSSRSSDLYGIVNGVDYSVWSPSRDKLIPYKYNLSNFSGKNSNRIELLGRAGLPIREKTPLVGMITRLAEQKGINLIVEAASELFDQNLQMVILGDGEERYEKALKELEKLYPDKLRVFLEFNDQLAHEIQAGSDVFLMPSRYEPCGLNQLYSMKYGTIPIVHKVGGLADTVTDYSPGNEVGTGFVFDEHTPAAMIEAVTRAVGVFRDKQAWRKLMKTGMRLDYSWNESAGKYIELYESMGKLHQLTESHT